MTVNAIPMAKQTASETVENDLGKTLASTKVTSEIDFLKRMKLRKQITQYIGTTPSAEDATLKEIADFQSADDKRIQDVYAKLIKMYQAAEAEKAGGTAERKARNEMANIYAQFGYKDLYQIAAVIAEIKRVKTENEDIMSTVTKVLTPLPAGPP